MEKLKTRQRLNKLLMPDKPLVIKRVEGGVNPFEPKSTVERSTEDQRSKTLEPSPNDAGRHPT